jgi:prepilin-type N-terminal cleavage/methylation domain-containing protein
MNADKNNPLPHGFTLTELLVVMCMMGLLTVIFVRAQEQDGRTKQDQVQCVNQLQKVGLAMRMWASDHQDTLPMQVEGADGGSLEAIKGHQPFRHFQVLSNELGLVKLVTCPSDSRKEAESIAKLQTTNVSYFVGLDAKINMPVALLSGDRNVTNGMAPQKGILNLSGKPLAGWTDTLHHEAGNLGLSDGSVRQSTTAELRRAVEFAERAKNTGDDGKIRIHLPEVGAGSE